MQFPKPTRKVDKDLLREIACLPCVACQPGHYFMHLENPEMCSPERLSDPHHVTTRGAGGGDTRDNVMPLCPQCHARWHSIGGLEMAKRHHGVFVWLLKAEREDVLEGFRWEA